MTKKKYHSKREMCSKRENMTKLSPQKMRNKERRRKIKESKNNDEEEEKERYCKAKQEENENEVKEGWQKKVRKE